jgi:hypothetical protein
MALKELSAVTAGATAALFTYLDTNSAAIEQNPSLKIV